MRMHRLRRPALIMADSSLLRLLGVFLALSAAPAMAENTASSASARPWLQRLCLGNEGYWRQRLRIVVRNDSDSPLTGSPVKVVVGKGAGCADLEGQNADSLRLVNEAGIELLWALTTPEGKPVKRGPIASGNVLVLPAECPAHGQAICYLYFDNPEAWAVPDALDLTSPQAKEGGKTPQGVSAQAMELERLEGFRELGGDASWPADAAAAGWEYRLPTHVMNLTRQALGNGLVSVDLSGPLARYQRSVDPGVLQVMDGGKAVESFRLGTLLVFNGQAETLTRRTFHVYFRGSSNATKAPETSAKEYAANPALPDGQNRRAGPTIARTEYDRLLTSAANLVKNPSFETGEKSPKDWSGGADNERPAGVQMGFAEPGLFGNRCVRMSYPVDAQPQWVGWRQEVPVKPGRTYLYAAWLKCQDLTGSVQLHAHFHDARGELCREQQMTSVGPEIHGTTDWTLLHGLLSMPPDVATVQLHLTMLAKGTVWHDGVVVTEITPGSLGRMETRAASTLTEPVAWPVNAVVKVFQDDLPPRSRGPARITAARNDQEPLQLALRSPRALQKVKVTVEVPANVNGKQLGDVSVGIVGFVPVDHPTSYYSSTTPAWYRKVPSGPGRSDGWPGWWPDPILPRDTFDLAARVTQPVWITVSVPKDAAAGDYNGTVRFATAGASVLEVPFTVRVWDFALPDTMHIKAIYDCRQDESRWAVPGKTPDQARREFWRFMAQRRLCPDTIKPEPTLRYENGKMVSDFTAFDEAGEFYFNTLKLPHAYSPWSFYGFGWGHPPSEHFGEQPYEGKPPFESADRAKLRPEFKRAYQACLKTFWEHLKAKGWSDKFVLYISDEPFDAEKPIREQMKALCDMIHEVDRSIPVYCSTWHHQPEWDGYLDVWGLGHYGVVSVDKLRQIRDGGAHLWWTTDGHMCIDTPYCAVERLLPHYCFKYGAEAYEFWGVDWLTYNPYEYGWHSYIHQSEQPGKFYYVRYPNGDGYLAYPGAPIGHDGPVSSVRLEQAREGCEDYEYLYLLREAIASAKKADRDASAAERALAGAQELVTIPNAGGLQSTKVLPNPDAVLEVKERVARAIESCR